MLIVSYVVLVQTGSETVSGNMGMPRPETKRSGIFGKIPDWDRDRWVWSGLNRVPIGLGPYFPNTSPNAQCWLRARSLQVGAVEFGDKLLGALYIADGAPFVFFNAIALPAY